MLITALILTVLAIAVFVLRKDQRRGMLCSATLSLPIALLPLFFRGTTFTLLEPRVITDILTHLLIAAGLASLLSAAYHLAIHKRVTPSPHQHRGRLIWFLLAPLAAFSAAVFAGIPLIVAILAATLVTILVLGIVSRHLLAEAAFAGLGIGLVYAATLLIYGTTLGGVEHGLWLTSLSGITFRSMPVEELISLSLFGTLFGPTFLALKGSRPDSLGTLEEVKYQHSGWKLAALALVGIATLLGTGFTTRFVFTVPEVRAVSPSDGTTQVEWNTDVTIHFDNPVSRSELNPSISPDVEGEWIFGGSSLGNRLFTSLTFRPSDYLLPDQLYTVKLAHIAAPSGRGDKDYSFSFRSRSLPAVASYSLKNDQTDVAPCSSLTAVLDSPNDHRADFVFSLDPTTPLEASLGSDLKTYTLKPASCLDQGVRYTLSAERSGTVYDKASDTVVRRDASKQLGSISFNTKQAPGLIDYSPKGSGILVSQKELVMKFDQTVSPDQKLEDFLVVEPGLTGSWSIRDGSSAIFTPTQTLAFATAYKVTAKVGLKDGKGGFLKDEHSVHFTTIGPATVTRISPSPGSSGISPTASVSFTFDQEVDHSSAEAAFSLTPTTAGTFSWSGRTLTFNHSPFSKDERYTLSVASGIKSIDGQPTARSYSSTFVTEESVTMLSIPVYFQRKALSCEVASLAMALGYKGVNVSEETLLSQVGFDSTPRSDGVWGDPDQAFVGSVDGKQNTSGYGVHAGPIGRVANTYRPSSVVTGTSLSTLTSAIADGNPVVIWGVYPGGTRDPWITPAGRTINAWKGEHVRTLIGFKGKADNPRQLIINDPISGRLIWDRATFLANWATYGNMAVIVR